MTASSLYAQRCLELAFTLGYVLHHLHFLRFIAFSRGRKTFKLDGGALGEVLSDLFSACHEILQLGSVDC